MSERKIVVPEGMLKAATGLRTDIEYLRQTLTAALRWLCPQIEALKGEEPEGNAAIDDVLKLFAAPEPEIPEEVKDLRIYDRLEANNKYWDWSSECRMEELQKLVEQIAIEAFIRGRRVGKQR